MSTSFVQSVLRALDVLEAVSASGSGLTLTELSDDLGLKAPTAFNLAKTLVARGYLEKTSRPVRYLLGPSLTLLSQRQERTSWLRAAESAARELFTDLGDATVLVAENRHGDFIPRLRIDPSRPAVLEHVINRHLSPYSAAVSLCFQAFWSPGERLAFRQRYPFSEYGQGAWSAMAEVDRFLSRSRDLGYVLIREPGPIRTAAPVTASDGALLGCIGASLNRASDRIPATRVEQFVHRVCRIAADLAAHGSNSAGTA